ncbi:hypothetical protein GGI05_001818, partial [Coemansia sp. RSA 2603]
EVGRHFRQNSSIQPGRNANPEASGSFTLSLPEGPLEYLDNDPGSSGGSSPCECALAFRNNTLPPDRARPTKLTSRVRRVFRHNRSNTDGNENQTTTSANEANSEPVAEQHTEIAQQPSDDPVYEFLQNLAWQSKYNSVEEMMQDILQQPTQGPEHGLQPQVSQQPTQVPVDGLQLPVSQQPTQNSVDGLLQPVSQQPADDWVDEFLQNMAWQSACGSVDALLQNPAQQSSQELSQEPTHVPTQELTQESTQKPTQEPTQEVVQTSIDDNANRGVNTKRLHSDQDPPPNVNQADTTNLSNEEDLLSSDMQYKLVELTTERFRSLEYTPRRAIVHQFSNMDSETVVAYGDDKLQLWNPITKGIVEEWDGEPHNVHIGQVEPVSTSTLAIVSTGAVENERVSKAGRLHFADLNWSTENNRFSDMAMRQWVGDAVPIEDVSVVEGVHWEDTDDESELLLFTGSMTDGAVYRRKFNITDGKVKMVEQLKMVTDHGDAISALCHVLAIKCVISGTSSGNICLNDRKTGSCIQSFSLDKGATVSSFTHCPFNPNMFLVGSRQPENKLMIFDIRENMRNGSKLVLQDAGSTITAPSNKPAWDTATGLVLAPVRRIANDNTIATIDIWEPRFVRCKDAIHFGIHSDEKEVFSVDFTDPADVNKRVMVTASEKSIGFTTSRTVTY